MDCRVARLYGIEVLALAALLGPVTFAEAQQAPKPAAPATSVNAPRKAAKPPPSPITSLEVTVTDPTGKPVEGAFVIALPAQASGLYGNVATEKSRSTFTGRGGKANLESLPPGPWTVTVHARGFVTRPLRRVTSGPLAVRLDKGGVVTGVVLEADGRRPVAGARVAADAGTPLPGGWSDQATRNAVSTDALGRFRLEGIGRAPVTLSARARGFGRAERRDVRAGASLEMFLFPGASLAGVVRDDAGRPLAGAVVRAEGDQSRNAPPAERTDARGEFWISGIQPGECTAVARAGARAPGIAAVVIDPQGEAFVSLTVSDGGFAIGRIVDAEGRPLAGRVRVEAVGERALPAFASDLMEREASADGSFTLGPLPLGTLGLLVSAPRHAPRRVDALVPAPGRTADLGPLVLEAGLSIRGVVRDGEGNAVAGAAVRASRRDPVVTDATEAVSATDGTFVVGGLGSGTHRVAVSSPGYATALATATPGGEPLAVVLEPGGEVAGRVVDADGSPVVEAEVSAEESSRSISEGRSFHAKAEEGDGGFVLREVPAGSYSLEARAAGRGEAALSGVRVVAGRTTSVGTITLGRGGVLHGVVVDAEGNGIPGASVSAERDARFRMGRYQTQTGSTGAFEMRGVAVGPVYVSAKHPAYAAGPDVATTVEPVPDPVPLRLVLSRGGRLEGRALYRDGRAFAGGRVTCASLGPRAPGMRWETAAIDGDGSFAMDHVTPGPTRVTLMAFAPASPAGPSANMLSSVVSKEVEVREAETTFVDLALRDVVMMGRVTRSGQPEPGVLVSVRSGDFGARMMWSGPSAARAVASGPPPLAAVTNDDGSYELVVFSPGRTSVELESGGQRYPSREVEVADTDRFQLDLELGATTVSGFVVDRDDGSAVPEASVGLRRSEGNQEWTGGADTGPDGRFSIAAEPGEYRLDVRTTDRRPASLPISVGPAGVVDLRVELERGLEIRGRILDGAGRPASGLLIFAAAADGAGAGRADSGPDGRFRLRGLGPQPHAIVGGSELAGFAVQLGVSPAEEPIELVLRPAGRIAVRVVDPAGQPVRGVYPRVEALSGQRVRLPGRVSGATDASGLCELLAPPGAVDVVVSSKQRSGRGSVSVRPGEAAPLTILLQPEPAKAP